MTNVGKGLKASLPTTSLWSVRRSSRAGFSRWHPQVAPAMATDGAHNHNRGAEIECVYIPGDDRGTLCVSSQVGCTLTCSFCHTGTQRLVRNLSTAEIVAQLVVARDALGDFTGQMPGKDGGEPGRWSPTSCSWGMASRSTSRRGDRCHRGDVGSGRPRALAAAPSRSRPRAWCRRSSGWGWKPTPCWRLSLHAVRDDLRDELVPLKPQIPDRPVARRLPELSGLSNARRITFEYVMLNGRQRFGRRCPRPGAAAQGHPAKINLIPFNPWPGSKYECSDWERIALLRDRLHRRLRLRRCAPRAGVTSWRLRPAQERDREAARPRPADARRGHGRRGRLRRSGRLILLSPPRSRGEGL